MSVTVRNLSTEVCRWYRGRRPHLSISLVFAKWAECRTTVGEPLLVLRCVCVCVRANSLCAPVCMCWFVCLCCREKRAYQDTDRTDWKIGRRKVRRAKPGNLQTERVSFDVCLHSFQCWWKGSCWTVVEEREHLKLNEALRKTHTGSHNKKSCESEIGGEEKKDEKMRWRHCCL